MQPERRRTIGGMLLLTLLGGALMLPPAVYVFSQPISHFGIPQIVFYLFAVWLVLIIGTARLARALPDDETEHEGSEAER